MTSKEIRENFSEFFREKGHIIIPSASLIPKETDPTVLFTTAGMHPLVPYLLGEKHPGGNRVANVQKCIRTVDIDEVGDNSHLTFFEMLGNWSFGDYFKKEAIEWSWEFLTSSRWLALDPGKIAISVFHGDEDASFDEESYKIWKKLGISENRITKLPKKNNWWGPAGTTGPCGPDTEMFYWVGDSEQAPEVFDPDDNSWLEVWNDVFMEYNKNAEGKYESLKQKNVDTGMGLERMAMVMQDAPSVFETDLFAPIVAKIKSQIPARRCFASSDAGGSNLKSSYKLQVTSYRIIADHIKAATFIIVDGVEPSNIGRGYVLRRLIRRAVRHGKLLGIEKDFTKEIAEVIIDIYKDSYHEAEKNKEKIFEELGKEEERFRKTLESGLREFNKLSVVSGKDAFNLYQTYGFPFEMTKELAQEKGLEIDEKEFNKEFEKHQELSRTASAGMFKGGLAEASEQTIKYHTATHLLHQALREVLGDHVTQKGSNITAERLRFDFNYPQKLTNEQIQEIENLVNEKIKEEIPVQMVEMPKNEALKIVKTSFDPSKYGDIVKVYKIDDFSVELCGGPHAENTGQLGHFKILKEEASAAGIRRIKAMLE